MWGGGGGGGEGGGRYCTAEKLKSGWGGLSPMYLKK